MFSLNKMILHTSPRVVKVDRFNADVRIEGVLVEENRTARKVGHVKTLMKDFVFYIIRSFLQSNNMPFHRNLFLDSIFLTSSVPRVRDWEEKYLLTP